MKLRIVVQLLFASLVLHAAASEIDVHVVTAADDKPIVGATITARFAGILALGHEMDELYAQKTDAKGNCHFTGTNNNPHVNIELADRSRKPKYYRTSQKVELKRVKEGEPLVEDYHSITLRVQQVGKPVPMFVKYVESPSSFRTNLFSTVTNQVSYDLIAGAWLPPLGTGTVADVVFTRCEREDLGIVTNKWRAIVNLHRQGMKVTFPGEGNGVVRVDSSVFSRQIVTEAPAEGYEHETMSYAWKDEYGIERSTWKPAGYRTYCFRIRTQKDENGTITGGYYGYVDDGFEFNHFWTEETGRIPIGTVSFRYYLNLIPLSRSLEWDRETNLNPNAR